MMAWIPWFAAAATLMAVVGNKLEPPPVILDLGRLQPTPAPTVAISNKKRLITVITVRNSADGESAITFEATDVATDGKRKIRILAGKSYSLSEENKKAGAKELSDKILHQLRALERDMLDYAELTGPPKQTIPVGSEDKAPETKQPE